MKTRICSLLCGVAFLLLLPVDRVIAEDDQVLEKLSVPSYPYLARLTGTQGTVGVSFTLDPQCNITDISIGRGSPRLVDAVTRAVYGGGVHVLFRPCASAQTRTVRLSFIFSLQGQPTNGWSPTRVRVSSEHALSFNIEITTTPADLEALGLEKKSGDSQRNGAEAPGQGNREMLLTNLLLPSYPPLARIGRVQGDVIVAAELDSKCQVSTSQIVAGHPLLNSAVLEAVRGWHFTSCAAGGGKVDAAFHFVLAEPDEPTSDSSDWAPTHFEMTGPYEFQIKTVAPDPIVYN